MIELNAATASIFISILISLLGVAAWLGALHQKVKNNRSDINKHINDMEKFKIENKQDHEKIVTRLDTIIRNGRNN